MGFDPRSGTLITVVYDRNSGENNNARQFIIRGSTGNEINAVASGNGVFL